MQVTLTEAQLKELLRESYKCGWYGAFDLCNSQITQIYDKFVQDNPQSMNANGLGQFVKDSEVRPEATPESTLPPEYYYGGW